MPSYNVMDLAKRLSALERKILSTKQPTLNRSAIDGGAIQGMDSEGNLRTVIGEQFDGTNTVSVVTGPTPPTPTAPLLTPGLGTVRTYWDGTFADGSMSPMDFRRVTVHATPSKDFTGFDPTDQSTIIGTISTATGGEVTSALASGQEYVVQLFAWSQAGKFSQGSMAATVTPEGVGTVEVIRNTPDDGPVTTISLGGLTDSVQIIDTATGTTLSSLNPDGTITSKGVSVDGDVVIRGRSIAGLVDAVDRAPQGIVAAYNLPGDSLQAGNAPLGIAEVNWVAQAGRMYKIVWDGYLNAPANNRVQLLFRMKIGTLERGASTPGVNDDSTIPASGVYSAPNAGLYRSHLEAVYRGLPGADYQARVLLVMVNLDSNSPIYASGYGSTIYVEDMGIGSFSGGYSASGGGTPYAASSADTTTAAPVAPPRTYTTTWGATWMTSLRTDGAAVSDALQQGYYAPNYRRSAIGFNTGPSSAGSIYKALAGASIQKVELYLKNSTFYSSSGGNANVDMSTLSTAPSSIGAITGRGLARNFKFAVGEGKWVTLNSDTWAGLKDGSTRSVVLGTTAGAADYARFSKADPPKIRITYVR